MKVLALSLLAACSFSTDVVGEQGDDMGGDDGVEPTPSTRCLAGGLAVCIDFEDMPTPKDGVLPEAMVTAENITPQTRLEEGSAQLGLAPISKLRVTESPKLDITQTLTIEMWTKPTIAPANIGDKQAGLFDASGQYQLNFRTDRKVECVIYGDGDDDVESGIALTLGAWHHVACTYDGASLKLYVDGKLEGCSAATRTIATAGTGAAIGANMLGALYLNPFVGELDNVHLYARTLPAAEICTLWGNGNCSDRCPGGGPGGPGGGF